MEVLTRCVSRLFRDPRKLVSSIHLQKLVPVAQVPSGPEEGIVNANGTRARHAARRSPPCWRGSGSCWRHRRRADGGQARWIGCRNACYVAQSKKACGVPLYRPFYPQQAASRFAPPQVFQLTVISWSVCNRVSRQAVRHFRRRKSERLDRAVTLDDDTTKTGEPAEAKRLQRLCWQ